MESDISFLDLDLVYNFLLEISMLMGEYINKDNDFLSPRITQWPVVVPIPPKGKYTFHNTPKLTAYCHLSCTQQDDIPILLCLSNTLTSQLCGYLDLLLSLLELHIPPSASNNYL